MMLALSGFVFSQAHLLNAYTPEEAELLLELENMEDFEPLSFGYVDNRDVLWSKVVWEIVDLDERVNFPFYFPVDSTNIDQNRRSLFKVLVDGIRDGDIMDVYDES